MDGRRSVIIYDDVQSGYIKTRKVPTNPVFEDFVGLG